MSEKKAHKPKARANGEGTLFQRKSDNLWVGRLPIGFKPDGSVKYRQFTGKKQSDVREKMDQVKTEVRTNTYVEPNKITLGEWLDTWLNITMKTAIKETTFLSYEVMIRKHIKPVLGGYKLSQLQTADIQKLYNDKMQPGARADEKTGPLSPRTVRYIHQVIHGALKQAVYEKVIQVNVADHVKLPKNPKKEMKYLDISAVEKFLNVAKNNGHYNHYYAAFFLELYSGLRRGELLGIRWKDINLKEGIITVSQQLVKVGNKHIIRELKTESSQNRTISVPDEVITVLKAHKTKQEQQLKDLGYNDIKIAEHFKNGLVFVNELGGSIQPRNFTRCFKGILKKAKLDPVRFHDMRHTFALISLQAGTDIKTLQSDLGHESIETTLDKYGHVNNEMKRDAANKRSSLLKAAIKE